MMVGDDRIERTDERLSCYVGRLENRLEKSAQVESRAVALPFF